MFFEQTSADAAEIVIGTASALDNVYNIAMAANDWVNVAQDRPSEIQANTADVKSAQQFWKELNGMKNLDELFELKTSLHEVLSLLVIFVTKNVIEKEGAHEYMLRLSAWVDANEDRINDRSFKNMLKDQLNKRDSNENSDLARAA